MQGHHPTLAESTHKYFMHWTNLRVGLVFGPILKLFIYMLIDGFNALVNVIEVEHFILILSEPF